MNWKQGQRVNGQRYEIVGEIGRGGFGVVYKAIDHESGPQSYVVIKTINDDHAYSNTFDKLQDKFREEGLKLAKCDDHPGIVSIEHFFMEQVRVPRQGQQPLAVMIQAIVMEYVVGVTLGDYIKSQGGLSEAAAISLIQKVGEAVAYLHGKRISHRDLHPGNILIRENGEPVLIDFGLARAFNGSGLVPVTPYISDGYAPPERATNQGSFEPASDIYSLAMTLYVCITCQPPRSPEDRRKEEMVRSSRISDRLHHAIMQGIALDLRQRPQTVAQWLAMMVVTIPQTKEMIEPPPNSFEFEAATLSLETITEWQEVATVQTVVEQQPRWFGLGEKDVEVQKKVLSRKPVTRQVWEVQRRSKRAEYLEQELEGGMKLSMVKIPAGSFLMGQTVAEKQELIRQIGEDTYQQYYANELPRHLVNVSSFYMGKYPVTQSQYLAVMKKNPAHFLGGNLPVENVSWNDAQKFCQQLSAQSGKNYRLPSDAEWEYACRAGTETPFHFGETIITDVANFDGNYCYGSASKGEYLKKTSPVGGYGVSNGFGLYDMHGNIWEWCEDGWHESYEGAPIDGSAWLNNDNDYRLLRGGCWCFNPWDCRSAYRVRLSAGGRNSNLGFRVVFSQDSSHSAL